MIWTVAVFIWVVTAALPSRADLPATHYRGSRLVSVWLPFWMDADGAGSGWRDIEAHAQDIDEVSFFSWDVDSQTGKLIPPAKDLSPDTLRDQITWLHTRDVAALFTVTVFDKVHDTLNNPPLLAAITQQIVETARLDNFDGVDIDFEEFKSIDSEDPDKYTAFLDGLAKAMHAERDTNGFPKVVIATTLADTQRGKFGFTDEAAIANSGVDRIRVMAYDDFYPRSKTAGACAPLPWTQSVVRNIDGLNCPHWKFILGVPGYGYAWPVGSPDDTKTAGKGATVTFPKAQATIAQFAAKTSWDTASSTTRISYKDPATAQNWLGFYEDARSWGAKIDGALLPSQFGGLCEWAVGYEDPASWPVIEQRLATRYPIYGAIGQCYARYGGGVVFGSPVGPPNGWGAGDDRLPLGREGIEQRFEHGTISYRWGDWNATWVKDAHRYIEKGNVDESGNSGIGDGCDDIR